MASKQEWEAGVGQREENVEFQINQRIRDMADVLPVCISYVDRDYRYSYVNATYSVWFGRSLASLLGKTIAEVIGPQAWERTRGHVALAMAGEAVRYEAFVPYATGGGRYISADLVPDRGVDGQVRGCYSLVQDISERKAAEQKTQTSDERWKLALESTGDGVWDWYVQSEVQIFSPRCKEIYGYADADILNIAGEFDRRTHPDDLAQLLQNRQAHFDGLTPNFVNEHRILCKDGSWKWIMTRGTVIARDADGKPLRMIGTHTDISDRKHSEEELQLAALVYQHSSEAMMVCDAELKIITVNPAFSQLTGYSAEDVQGLNPRFLNADEQEDHFLGPAKTYLQEQGKWQGEVWSRRKNGDLFAEKITINSIRHPNGTIHRFVALFSDVTEQKKSEATIWQQANFDALTGLPNRSMFRDRLEQGIIKSKRRDLPLALMFIDLDHFKEVNDTLGHDVGDQLLIEAARRIRACVRESDTVARLGGDEFTVALAEVTDLSRIDGIGQSILNAMALPFVLGEEHAYISASIGITMYPNDGQDMESLLKHADQAMYAAKGGGRNRYSFFTSDLQVAAQARMRLTNDLRSALKADQFRVHFQPIIHLASGAIHKAEALIRWQHPQRGLVNPADFIRLAESSGLIVEIGNWVFNESAHWVKRWRNGANHQFQVSVNQSPIEFQREVEGHISWQDRLHAVGLPGQAMVAEITEGLLLDASQPVIDKLLGMRDAGIQVALDDFGTGYSSLSYLNKFDIDYLKIDQSFTRNLAPGSADMALSEAMIVMAHKLGLKVIAEGVETTLQRDLLLAAGCDYAQGFLYSEALAPGDFEKLLNH